MLPACLVALCSEPDLLEEADYPAFIESGLLHAETPAGGILDFRVVQVFKGTSDTPIFSSLHPACQIKWGEGGVGP